MVGKYISMVVCDRRRRDLLVRAGWVSLGVGVGSWEDVGGGVHGHGGGFRIIVFLPDIPVQCTPVLFGEECLGHWVWRIGRVVGSAVELAYM